MLPEDNTEVFEKVGGRPILTDRKALISELSSLSGNEIVDRILGHANPRKIVQELPSEDFFWLMKKVGEDDCLPLLELASVDQWQYLLDLEIWRKDRLDPADTSRWVKRLFRADPRRLVEWLFTDEGELLGDYLFAKNVEVITKAEDEVYDLPDGFFSLDSVFYLRVIASEHRETIEAIIREMAAEDFHRYQELLGRIAVIIPAEVEEELYRVRNMRLAEHGFFPFEEALSVYAPLPPEALIKRKKLPDSSEILFEKETLTMVPVSPLYLAGAKNLLLEAISRMSAPAFADRILLEFASLCNRILSADGLPVHELDVLVRTCRKAAGYVNVAIEKLSGKDLSLAEQILESYSLSSLFRVGFGLALKLKWEAEQWMKKSWFYGRRFDPGFWGESWGGILGGILQKRPQLYMELQDGREYRDFERKSEIEACERVFCRVRVLDGLLERIATLYSADEGLFQSGALTFHPFLFNLWACQFLRLEPCFSGISLEEAKSFFSHLRKGSNQPPFQMPGFEERFIKDFMAYAPPVVPEEVSLLKDTLSLIWQEFSEEYAWVSVDDLDGRYSKFISINQS